MTKQTIAEEFALGEIKLRPRYGNKLSKSKIRSAAEKKRRVEQDRRLEKINQRFRKEQSND